MKRLFSDMSLSAVLGRLKRIDSHRVLSFVMALAMLIPMIPSNIFAIFAVESNTESFAANVGHTAMFNSYFGSFPVSDDPTQLYWDPEHQLSWDDALAELRVVITDYYVHNEGNNLTVIWYKVEAAPGHVLPEKLVKYPWVYQNYVGEYADPEDSLIIFSDVANYIYDAEGNPIDPEEGLAVYEYGKTTIRAQSSLQGNVTYQWQMCYDRDKNLWVDIYNQTSTQLNLTYAMVKNVLDHRGTTWVRYYSSNGTDVIYSVPVELTVFYDADSASAEVPPQAGNIQKSASEMSRSGVMPIDDYTTYTITVYFVDENGKKVFEDHVESWPAGTPITHEVAVPNMIGYDAYAADDPDKETITYFTLADRIGILERNYEFTVIYSPAVVKYTIRYFFQNVTDDYYSERPEYPVITEYGRTGTIVTVPEPNIHGFEMLYYDQIAIAADGSTEIEVYLDRVYYLVGFELGEGGYGTEPIYARYESKVVATVPTRTGWDFQGWSPAIEIVNGAYQLSVLDNISYTALWAHGNTTFTVVYWKENADPDRDDENKVIVDENGHPVYSYSYWAHQVDLPATTGDLENGATYQNNINALVTDEAYFTFNPARTDSSVVIEGDGNTIVNVYYTRNTYDIYFYVEDRPAEKCQVEHTHGESCYQYICGKSEHTHVDSCLTCVLEEHKHTDSCCSMKEHSHDGTCCNITPHTHSAGCCSITPHRHSDVCYATATRCDGNGHSRNPEEGDTDSHRIQNVIQTCVYHNGQWYVSGNETTCNTYAHTHGMGCNSERCNNQLEHTHGVNCNSDKCTHAYAHTHGDGTCNCVTIAHTHSGSCYGTCNGSVEHTHTEACRRIACGQAEHDHDTGCTYAPNRTTYYLYKILTAKYNAYLGTQWPRADTVEELGSWSGIKADNENVTQSSAVLTMTSDWCSPTEIKLTANYETTEYHLKYWFEDVDQTNKEVSETRVWHEEYQRFYVLNEDYSQVAYSGNTRSWGYKSIAGMTATSNQSTIKANSTFDLYYNRTTDHAVEFINADHNTVLTFSDQKYGSYIKNLTHEGSSVQNYEPPYPNDFEPGAYRFDGWYTSPLCLDGTRVDWDTYSVPSEGNAVLYGKWVLKTHEVKVYLDSTMQTQIGATEKVLHGDPANGPDPSFDRGKYAQYNHDGWFYKDPTTGEEKAFLFHNMPVNRDLNIYAKWGSRVPVEYRIYFALGSMDASGTVTPVVDSEGNPIYVADPVSGIKLAGRSETFAAKAGDQLYPEYQGTNGNFYFPNTNSHTLVLSQEGQNTFTFYYVEMNIPGYTVQYLDAETGKPLLSEKKVAAEDNVQSVVTETFVVINGYIPDAYQKTLILSADEEENVITFYYKEDKVNAMYRVNHYVEQLDGSFALYNYYESSGVIGQTVPVEKVNISGYCYHGYYVGAHDPDNIIPGEVDAPKLQQEGYLVNLYYRLNTYPYEVQYLELGSQKQLAPKYVGDEQKYGAVVEVTAIKIPGYTLVSSETLSRKIGVNNNVITFYYTEDQVQINYVLVPEEAGSLSLNRDTVLVSSGMVRGSTVTPGKGYKFIGWFKDPYGNERVDESWLSNDGLTLTPQQNDGGLFESATYYAVFERVLTSLKIQVDGIQDVASDKSIIFHIEGEGVDLYVSVQGDQPVTIHGLWAEHTYTVTEITDWSWEYDFKNVINAQDSSAKITPVNGEPAAQVTLSSETNHIIFMNDFSDSDWLEGEGGQENVFNNP